MVYHKELANGRWAKLSFCEQMANVGSEVGRTISWRNKGNKEYSERAFDRALELLDLTIANEKEFCRLRELLRVRETLVDYFMYDNIYGSSDEKWDKYFLAFNYAARLN
ncbi:MAG: hypothetical protein FD145_657 [Candidatus Saganbacteria bacterium]|uniref:Uncharacterized protein n=1 Tax=Candidatus Saganbacteria bacterium TaxID=2575572 RepID=A0A833L406_UNCSA|nr:MAG: hypothetical protein FD145_657 [Candidatus Saganbacteria bacterium]